MSYNDTESLHVVLTPGVMAITKELIASDCSLVDEYLIKLERALSEANKIFCKEKIWALSDDAHNCMRLINSSRFSLGIGCDYSSYAYSDLAYDDLTIAVDSAYRLLKVALMFVNNA